MFQKVFWAKCFCFVCTLLIPILSSGLNADEQKAEQPKADENKTLQIFNRPLLRIRSVTPPKPPKPPKPPSQTPPSQIPTSQSQQTPKALPLLGDEKGIPTEEVDSPSDRTAKASRPKSVSLPDDIRPSSFKNLTPGVSALADVHQSLGKPYQSKARGEATAYFYREGPFPQVEVVVQNDIVETITIQLKTPMQAPRIVRDIGLAEFEPAPVRDGRGRLLGKAFPDRGVILDYALPHAEKQPKVTRIHLSPITAAPFLWRVQHALGFPYQRSLRDLDVVKRLDPQNRQADWRRARILAAVGRFEQARQIVKNTADAEPKNTAIRLFEARLLHEVGEYQQAIAQCKQIVEGSHLAPIDAAAGQLLYGDLLFAGPNRDAKNALKHHLAAIEKAAQLAGDEKGQTRDAAGGDIWRASGSEISPAIRRQAKQILFQAHLSVAADIGWGDWKSRKEVALKWLRRAQLLADHLVQIEKADPSIQLQLYRKWLFVYAGLKGAADPTSIVDLTITQGRRFIAGAKDPLRKRELEYELGEGLCYAVLAAQHREDLESSLRFADHAVALLEDGKSGRDVTPHHRYLMGRLYYSIGAAYASRPGGARDAAPWYEKAALLLSAKLPPAAEAEKTQQGDRFVSMGVSLWRSGKHQNALQLTNHGARLLQEAVNSGAAPRSALAPAYGNLAAMYKGLGHHQMAETFAENAALLKESSAERMKR